MIVDPIALEIIRHRLDVINDEAAITLQHVSGSQIAVESNDLNTAITAADGRVIACGRYILAQVASIHLVIDDIRRHYSDNPGIGPGDQFVTNDPYVGTLHQPDVVVVAPVFAGDELVAWVGSTVHQSDVGGPTPGGMTLDARSVFDEPMPMPPVRMVEGGRVRPDIERQYLIRSRTPELNALDLAGQIAANRAAATAIAHLCGRFGNATVTAAMDRLLDSAERQLRDRLAALPDGRWRHVMHLEYGGTPPGDVVAVRLTATKRGETLTLDFSESSPQASGAINTAYPALMGFSLAAVLVYLCGGLPWVPGALTGPVTVTSREGTLVHARWPAGVAMSTGTVAQAVRTCVNVVLGRMREGLARDEPALMAGCQVAGAGGMVLSGRFDDGTVFASMTLDEVAGGGGARSFADGVDSGGLTTSPGGACANIEVNESYLPVRYLTRRELADTGGPGRYRGGVGCLHVLTPHAVSTPIGVLSFAQGLQHPGAAGLAGGEPGRSGAFAVVPAEDLSDLLAGRGPELPIPTPGVTLRTGQVHVAVSQGGGGIGDPLDRDPAAVMADVRDGLVSPGGARADYGVVIEDGALDVVASVALREARRRDRLGGRDARPPLAARPGRRLSVALDIVADRITCARCGADLCGISENVHEHLVLEERPASRSAPMGLRFAGSERFVVRHFHCGGCAAQVDVLVAAVGEPLLWAVDPSPMPPDGDGPGAGDRATDPRVPGGAP